MEIILASVVASAVIFFGALISMGNERQRRALDDLREQVVLWAMQDLKIKRERLARNVSVDDPLGWLNKITARALGYHQNLQVLEVYSEPRALVCVAEDATNKVIFSSLSPEEIRNLIQRRRNRLSQFSNGNPLLTLPRKFNTHDFSALNNGVLFDLELALVWKALTNQEVDPMERLWMYSL
jgi:hypothetical protein